MGVAVPTVRAWLPKTRAWFPNTRAWLPNTRACLPNTRAWIPKTQAWLPKTRTWFPGVLVATAWWSRMQQTIRMHPVRAYRVTCATSLSGPRDPRT